jgi:hypothetical protein
MSHTMSRKEFARPYIGCLANRLGSTMAHGSSA